MRKALGCMGVVCALLLGCDTGGPVPGAPPPTVPSGPSVPTVAPPDAGTSVDAGTPDGGTRDGGTADGGTRDGGTPDGGTRAGGVDAGVPDGGMSADCEGLLPAAQPGEPVQVTTDLYDGNGDVCVPGQSDGRGNVTVGMQSWSAEVGTTQEFFTPQGRAGQRQGGRWYPLVPQTSGFQSVSSFTSEWVLDTFTGAGALTTSPDHQPQTAVQAEDPLGGLLVFATPSGTTVTSSGTLISFDPVGDERWELPVTGPGGGFESLGVDRAGNILIVFFEQPGSSTGPRGMWISHDGAPLSGWFPMIAGSLVPRVGDGFFVRSGGYLAQIDARATSTRAAPAWLSAVGDRELHMVHGGRGYAVLPAPSQPASPCEQTIEVYSPTGAACGSVRFFAGDAACSTMPIAIGYDGTVIQGVPHEIEGCNGVHCLCAYRWWPGYFR